MLELRPWELLLQKIRNFFAQWGSPGTESSGVAEIVLVDDGIADQADAMGGTSRSSAIWYSTTVTSMSFMVNFDSI